MRQNNTLSIPLSPNYRTQDIAVLKACSHTNRFSTCLQPGSPKIVSGPPKTSATPPDAAAKRARFYKKLEGDFQLNFLYSIPVNGEALAAGPRIAVNRP